MNFFRFGFVDFFGILAPGVILLINLLIFFYALLGLYDDGVKILTSLQDSKSLQAYVERAGSWIILSVLLLIICYLWGFILRLVRPDLVDKAATMFLKITSPKKFVIDKYKLMFELEKEGKLNIYKDENKTKRLGIFKRAKQFNRYLRRKYIPEKMESGQKIPSYFWSDEKFPYYFGTKYVYDRNLPKELSEVIMKEKRYHNANMYNYWKLLLTARNPNISSMIFQAEAYVRFMCGSFWALSFGLFAGLILSTTILINPHPGSDIKSTFGIFLVGVSGLMLSIILTRFKNQRRREVKMILDAVIITTLGNDEIDLFRIRD